MRDAFNLALVWLNVSKGKGIFLLLYFAVLLGLLFRKKKDAVFFLSYTFFFFVLYFAPPIAYILIRLIGADTYWRMFWILPIPALIACGGVHLISAQRKKGFEILALVLVVLVVAGAGRSLYLGGAYHRADNLQKLSGETIQLSELLEAKRGETATIYICLPDELNCEIRQYNGEIFLPYGRRINEYPQFQELYDAMNAEELDEHRLAELLREAGCNYVAHAYVPYMEENLTAEGFSMIGIVGNYMVFQDVTKKE